jgi:hypothetical protein
MRDVTNKHAGLAVIGIVLVLAAMFYLATFLKP